MRWILAGIFALACFNVSANTTICNSCSSTAHFRTAAAGAPIDGTMNVYIVNTLTKEVRKFRRDGVEWPVENAVSNYVKFVASGVERQVHLDNQWNFPQNGYELVERPELAANVGAYLQDGGLGFVNDFLRFLATVNPINGFNPGAVSMTIRVILVDGATSLFVYNPTTKT